MRRVGLILAGVLLAGSAIIAERKQQDVELQAAIRQETVDGDLKGAIKQFSAIAVKYAKTDRAVVATALVHMAECYQKMGDAESRKIYEQVVKDYADQKEAVMLARARLGRQPESARSLAFRQIWKLPNMTTIQGTASHDGRYLPYVGWGPQHGNLFLHDFITGQDRQLTTTATDGMPRPKVEQFAEEFSVSPDGTQVAYSWFREDHNQHFELRLVNLKGDRTVEPRLLFDNHDVEWISPDDWSRDAKWIAVRLQRTDKTAQIGLVSVADSSLRVLKSVDWRGAGKVFFSPDGKYLGYDLPQSDTSQQRDVFVLAIDGSREIPAVVHRSHDTMMGWAPDGQRLLFASDRTGSTDLWSLPFADGKVHGEPELIKTEIGRAELIGLTQSGAMYLAVPAGANQPSHIQVAAFDFKAGQLLSAPADVTQEYLESQEAPSWSDDGRYLAYIAVRGRAGASKRVLVVRSADTRQLVRELPVNMNQVRGFRWAPDGRFLLLGGVDLKGRWGFFQMDAQTGEISPMILDPRREIFNPVWSHDRKSVYYTRPASGGERVLIQRNFPSGDEKELLRRNGLVAEPISPDGRYIPAAAIDRSTGAWLKLLIPTAGGEPREVMRVPAGPDNRIRLLHAQWAPDSRSLFTWKHLNDEKQTIEVWRIPVDGSAPVKLDIDLPGIDLFRLHPDGNQIIFSATEKGVRRGQEVWVLENFLPRTTVAIK